MSEEVKERLGFRGGPSGPHAARTMMLDEVTALFDSTSEAADRDEFSRQVVDANLLGKPSRKARELSLRHLMALYGLRRELPIYRLFRRLWSLDPIARPVLALSIALCRDPLLRQTQSLMLTRKPGESVTREEISVLLSAGASQRLSPASLKSFAQNINGTWTQAGFLKGKVRKTRVRPTVTPTNLSFCLFLAHLDGGSGRTLFTSPWVAVLDTPMAELLDMAAAAAQRGQIIFMNAGGVMEVRFPGYLSAEEERWRHE